MFKPESNSNGENSERHIEIILQYPSHGWNLGYVSKALRTQIRDISQNFNFQIESTYFEDEEKFIIEGIIEDIANVNYFRQRLQLLFGKFIEKDEIKLNDVVLGRIINPGKVGFGIFLDIGIRPRTEILMTLHDLRKNLTKTQKNPLRVISEAYGFIDHFPVELKISNLDEKTNKINVEFSDQQLSNYESWFTEGTQRLLISKYLNSDFEVLLRKLDILKFIEDIEYVDPLSTIINCKKRTRASGLLSILGPKLGSVPVGIFNPAKISSLFGN